MTTKHPMKIKVGATVKLKNGEMGTVMSVEETDSKLFPYVYEVKTKTSIHVTNDVKPLKKSLARLISITLNQ